MAAIFGNVRLDGRQFCDLMASRITDGVARVQGTLAMPTRVGDQIDDRVHTCGGDQRPGLPGMPRLTAPLALALGAATACALTAGEAIGGRRL